MNCLNGFKDSVAYELLIRFKDSVAYELLIRFKDSVAYEPFYMGSKIV